MIKNALVLAVAIIISVGFGVHSYQNNWMGLVAATVILAGMFTAALAIYVAKIFDER